VVEEAGDCAVDKGEVGLDFLAGGVGFGGAEVLEGDDVVELLLEVEVLCWGLILAGVS
jgi:hypothetical protein